MPAASIMPKNATDPAVEKSRIRPIRDATARGNLPRRWPNWLRPREKFARGGGPA
jgi:hypothetical protein